MLPCCSRLLLSFFPQVFERILFIWAIRHPASGYVQGINDLVTPFFVVFLSEFVSKLLVGKFLRRALLYSHWTKMTRQSFCFWFALLPGDGLFYVPVLQCCY